MKALNSFLLVIALLIPLLSFSENSIVDSLIAKASLYNENDTNKIKILKKICSIYIKNKDVPKALYYANISYKYSKNIQSSLYLGHTYNCYGRIFELQQNYQKSELFNKAALYHFSDVHYKSGISSSRFNLARLYLLKKDYENYVQFAFRSVISSEEFKDKFYWIYTGFFLFFFLYNLFIYFFSKDKAYLYISFCIFFFGYFNQFCVFEYQYFREFSIITGSIFYCILFSSVFLTCYYLALYYIEIFKSLDQNLSKQIKVLKAFSKISITIMILINTLTLLYGLAHGSNFTFWFNIFNFLNFNYDEIGAIVLFTILIYVLVVRYKQKIANLNYTVIAIIPLFSGIFFSELASNLHLGFYFLNPHAFGTCLFLVFLSVQVANKIEIFRKEKDTAQHNAMLKLESLVVERTLEINEQKLLIEEKQHEILDSIAYAKRLQEAILPPLNYIEEHIPDNFVLYKPKDIVAGDFYWAEKIEDKFYIAAADSTGHGVPGAMVSVVCSNALNRSVKEFQLKETNTILDKTRELVIETFSKSKEQVKDGMDISLLCIDIKNKKAYWSGANNPLWYYVNGEIQEIKADKQPIGMTENPSLFHAHEIDFEKGVTFYLFTDGFADQFGGPKGKKFKYKQFEEILLSNGEKILSEQAQILNQKFEEWKGSLEQVDDVCVIGVRV